MHRIALKGHLNRLKIQMKSLWLIDIDEFPARSVEPLSPRDYLADCREIVSKAEGKDELSPESNEKTTLADGDFPESIMVIIFPCNSGKWYSEIGVSPKIPFLLREQWPRFDGKEEYSEHVVDFNCIIIIGFTSFICLWISGLAFEAISIYRGKGAIKNGFDISLES